MAPKVLSRRLELPPTLRRDPVDRNGAHPELRNLLLIRLSRPPHLKLPTRERKERPRGSRRSRRSSQLLLLLLARKVRLLSHFEGGEDRRFGDDWDGELGVGGFVVEFEIVVEGAEEGEGACAKKENGGRLVDSEEREGEGKREAYQSPPEA